MSLLLRDYRLQTDDLWIMLPLPQPTLLGSTLIAFDFLGISADSVRKPSDIANKHCYTEHSFTSAFHLASQSWIFSCDPSSTPHD